MSVLMLIIKQICQETNFLRQDDNFDFLKNKNQANKTFIFFIISFLNTVTSYDLTFTKPYSQTFNLTPVNFEIKTFLHIILNSHPIR